MLYHSSAPLGCIRASWSAETGKNKACIKGAENGTMMALNRQGNGILWLFLKKRITADFLIEDAICNQVKL